MRLFGKVFATFHVAFIVLALYAMNGCNLGSSSSGDPNNPPPAVACEAIMEKSSCDNETSCLWDNNKCMTKAKLSKKVTVYTLTKIAQADHGIASNNIINLTASGNGKWVYLLGDQARQLMAYDVAAKTWSNPGGNWHDKFKMARDHNVNAGSLTTVVPVLISLASTLEGAMVMLEGDNGLLVVKGNGGVNSADTSIYFQNVAGLSNGDFRPFFASVTSGAANHAAGSYIYLSKIGGGVTVLFKQYVSPPSNDDPSGGGTPGLINGAWNDSLTAHGGGALAVNYSALAQNNRGDLLLGHVNGVHRVLEADVAFTGGAKHVQAQEVVVAADLRLDGATPNDKDIYGMAVIGDYLIMTLSAEKNANRGGVVIKNMVTNAVERFGAGLTLTGTFTIATNPAKNMALIPTDKGILLFANGTLIEPVAGEGKLVDRAYFDAHKANTSSIATAKSGFAGTAWDATANAILGTGIDKDGVWYIAARGTKADDGGIFTLEIKEETIAP